MIDILNVGIALIIVSVALLPLIGAQMKSLALTEELANQALHIKVATDDKEEKERVDFLMKLSRSWLFSIMFLLLGPFFAFRSGLKLEKRETDDSLDNFSELWLRTLFYSNPITMFFAIFACLIGVFLGKLIIFSLLSFCAITANDDGKLNVNMSAKTSYDIVENFTSAMAFCKHFRLGH